MKVAYFDCQFGAAGDMLLGALLDAGLSFDEWRQELNKIELPAGSFNVELHDVSRGTVACKKLLVLIPADATKEAGCQPTFLSTPEAAGDKASATHTHGHGHAHVHSQAHEHGHRQARQHEQEHRYEHEDEHRLAHGNGQSHTHAEGTRHLGDVLKIISNSAIDPRAKGLAARIFERLAVSEARVHGTSKNDVHFHEVGAVDAIVDIVGFAIGYTMLDIECSYVSAVPIGSGFVTAAHGTLAVPGPAVLYLLQHAGAATISSEHKFECLTPTGAAILCEVASQWGVPPSFDRITGVGYGAGSKDPAGWPNACRLVLGDATGGTSTQFKNECVAVVETNLDDLSPQALSYAVEQLFAAGALDVVVLPAVMKKGRSGHLVQVIARVADRFKMEAVLLAQTTSLGARSYLAQRVSADRQWVEVQLPAGEVVRLKIGRDLSGRIINVQPEFEDCAAYATAHGVALKEVMAEVMSLYRQQSKS